MNEENYSSEKIFLNKNFFVPAEPDFVIPDEDAFFHKFLRPCKWHAKSAFELVNNVSNEISFKN